MSITHLLRFVTNKCWGCWTGIDNIEAGEVCSVLPRPVNWWYCASTFEQWRPSATGNEWAVASFHFTWICFKKEHWPRHQLTKGKRMLFQSLQRNKFCHCCLQFRPSLLKETSVTHLFKISLQHLILDSSYSCANS